MRARWAALLAAAATFAAAAPLAPAAATVRPGIAHGFAVSSPGLTTGFSGGSLLTTGASQQRARWLTLAREEGAAIIRVGVDWCDIVPSRRPAGFDPANPASRGYRWGPTDAAVRDIAAHGMAVLLQFLCAPTWAEGPGRPRDVARGTWDPSPTQFAALALAAARRYSGTYPDPLHPGRTLPHVRFWQPWNEPNLGYYLSPQWRRVRGGWAPASPEIYRRMLNAFYGAVKSIDPSNIVVMAGTAPYGDPPGYYRMRPVQFYRHLFCLSGLLRRLPCPTPARLDAVDHHPYTFGPPTVPAYWPDDVAVADVWKIVRVLRAAERAGTVLPAGRKPVWVTELEWDSDPPSNIPGSVPVPVQARYLEQSLYLLWRQGVSVVLWFEIRDAPPAHRYLVHFDWGGLYFYSGAPKPAATAFRFPFATTRVAPGEIEAWGRAPLGGRLTISRRVGPGRWRVLARLSAGAKQVFQVPIALTGDAMLRAQVGQTHSLPWRQGP
jgi:hypothetical protein